MSGQEHYKKPASSQSSAVSSAPDKMQDFKDGFAEPAQRLAREEYRGRLTNEQHKSLMAGLSKIESALSGFLLDINEIHSALKEMYQKLPVLFWAQFATDADFHLINIQDADSYITPDEKDNLFKAISAKLNHTINIGTQLVRDRALKELPVVLKDKENLLLRVLLRHLCVGEKTQGDLEVLKGILQHRRAPITLDSVIELYQGYLAGSRYHAFTFFQRHDDRKAFNQAVQDFKDFPAAAVDNMLNLLLGDHFRGLQREAAVGTAQTFETAHQLLPHSTIRASKSPFEHIQEARQEFINRLNELSKLAGLSLQKLEPDSVSDDDKNILRTPVGDFKLVSSGAPQSSRGQVESKEDDRTDLLGSFDL